MTFLLKYAMYILINIEIVFLTIWSSKMKRALFFAVVLTAVILTACSPDSSIEEAILVISNQKDCDHIVQVISVEALGFCKYAFITKDYPKIAEYRTVVTHIAVYQTKDSSMKLVYLNDNHPPRIIGSRILK